MNRRFVIAGMISALCVSSAWGDNTDGESYGAYGDASVSLETKHAERGRIVGKMAIVPDAEVGYEVMDGARVYFGLGGVFSMKDREEWGHSDKISPRIGFSYDVTDMLTVDMGYTYKYFTKKFSRSERDDQEFLYGKKMKRGSSEIYVGVSSNTLLNPAVRCAYDINNEEINVEGSVLYNIDLSDRTASGLGIELGAKVGFDSAKKFRGIGLSYAKNYSDGWINDDAFKKDYFYYGASADLVYSFSDVAKARVGIEYVGNTAKKCCWVNTRDMLGGDAEFGNKGHKNNVLLRAGIDCSF